MSEKEVTNFGDLQEPMLRDLLEKTFIINGYSVGDAGRLGPRVTVDTEFGPHVTFSDVVLEQLKMIEAKNKFPVRVTLEEATGTSGKYYRFA